MKPFLPYLFAAGLTLALGVIDYTTDAKIFSPWRLSHYAAK